MNFTYRYVVNDKEEDDHWITLEEMLKHPDAEQFVGCLYELLVVHIGEVVTDYVSPVMYGAPKTLQKELTKRR
jgi:hypothetical protein